MFLSTKKIGLTLFNQLEMGAYGNTQYENHIVGNSIGSISFIHFDIYGEACNIGGNLITLKTEILMGNTIKKHLMFEAPQFV